MGIIVQVFVECDSGERCVSVDLDDDVRSLAAFESTDSFWMHHGRPLRQGIALGEMGVCAGSRLQNRKRSRGGLDTLEIILIAVGIVLGLMFLYWLLPKVMSCLRWFWRRILAPPIFFVYDYIFTPIGHCMRDSIFTCKEACCDCCDSCDTCCNPYKRI